MFRAILFTAYLFFVDGVFFVRDDRAGKRLTSDPRTEPLRVRFSFPEQIGMLMLVRAAIDPERSFRIGPFVNHGLWIDGDQP